MTDRRKALVGIVLPEYESVFAAAGHHSVGVGAALDNKVIDKRADVGR